MLTSKFKLLFTLLYWKVIFSHVWRMVFTINSWVIIEFTIRETIFRASQISFLQRI